MQRKAEVVLIEPPWALFFGKTKKTKRSLKEGYMDIYDHSPSIPMKEGWRVSVSGHADAACRIHITDKMGGKASLLYDPLGKLKDDGIPTWEIFPICWDTATVRLDEDILPWIERALIDSLTEEP